jgi:hypothetical protein
MPSGAADLQNDSVSRDALTEARGGEVMEKSKTLGEILVERGRRALGRST